MAPDLDALAQRGVDVIERWSRRAVKAATGLLVTVIAIITFTTLMGVIAFDGLVRVVFLTVALTFGSIGIGVSWLGRWRLGIALREAPRVTSEIKELIFNNPDARQTIRAYVERDDRGVETITAEPGAVTPHRADRARSQRFLDAGSRLASLRQVLDDGPSRFATLTSIAASAKTFPLLAAIAAAITAGFAVLGAFLTLVVVLQLVT